MTYSSTLDGGVSADDTTIYVADAPSSPYPPYLTIDSESVRVESVNPSFSTVPHPSARVRISVQRGALGTTRAAHDDGETVSGAAGAPAGGEPTTALVTLGGDGFDVAASRPDVPAGTIRFITTNVGYGHELLVIKTDDTAADIIAAAPIGGTFDESGYDVLLDTGTIAHGATLANDVSLEAGHYVLVCNEAGHAHLGMAIDWTVSGGTGGGVTVTVPPADPVAVTNIVAPGATIDGDTATLALLAQAIGPFAVSGTDADLAADWVKLTDLVEGSFVISVHVLCSVSFDGTGRLTVGVGNPAGGHDFAGIWTAAASPGPAAAGIAEVAASAPHGGLQSDPDGGLWATIDSVGSAGSADIYAIVAVPAS